MSKAPSRTPIILTVQEVTRLLRVQRPKVYELIKSNIIQGFKVGADWRIKRESVEKLIGPIPESFFNKSKKDELSHEEEAEAA